MTNQTKAAAKRAKKRAKAKANKQKMRELELEFEARLAKQEAQQENQEEVPPSNEPEYIADAQLTEEAAAMFKDVFAKFTAPEELTKLRGEGEEEAKDEKPEKKEAKEQKKTTTDVDKPMSRKERRRLNRLSIPLLKQLVSRPEVVEVHDVNSSDPKLLVHLKAYRNAVAVPPHWCQKRKYLQNKRGVEKIPFELPSFIASTGISKLRQAQTDKEAAQSDSQRARAIMNPKAGRIEIDYHVLHDAFFRYQTRPKMTGHGDLYYEGKEHQVKLLEKRPGVLSEELMRALGMVNGKLSPTPWLGNMQRYGPPPSYPNLKIGGVNAPIPQGCRYGYQEGEWGKPPVDDMGTPLYGDVYGTEKTVDDDGEDRTLWGQIEKEEEESSEEEEDDVEDEEEMDMSGMQSGIASTTSHVSGMDTPQMLQLRKADGTGTETPDSTKAPRQLYQVLEEKKTAVGSGIFGTKHTYVLPSQQPVGVLGEEAMPADIQREQERLRGQVEISLNPDELGSLDPASLKRKYETQLDKEQSSNNVDDLSEVLEEERRKKRRVAKDKKKLKVF